MWKELVILVFLCACLRDVCCYSSGAPTSACVEMLPGHTLNNVQVPEQESSTNPWFIRTDSSDYAVNQTIRGIYI